MVDYIATQLEGKVRVKSKRKYPKIPSPLRETAPPERIGTTLRLYSDGRKESHTRNNLANVIPIDQIKSTYKLQEEKRHIFARLNQLDIHIYHGGALQLLTDKVQIRGHTGIVHGYLVYF